MKIDVTELMLRSYLAGFTAAGEGYNGEYPFNEDTNAIRRELSEQGRTAIDRILQDVETDDA